MTKYVSERKMFLTEFKGTAETGVLCPIHFYDVLINIKQTINVL
jgi:hypothetical protein